MDERCDVLILGIGNVLMGDEGVGVHLIRRIENLQLPEGVRCLDGGTGSFQLLGPLTAAKRVILVDATADGREPGSMARLEPRFSRDYPPSLTAHDIGLKDLLDSLYLMENPPPVTLFAVSVDRFQEVGVDLSLKLEQVLPELVSAVLAEVQNSGDAPAR